MLSKKKYLLIPSAVIFWVFWILPCIAYAEPVTIDLPDALRNLKVGGEAYMDYSNGQTGQPGDQEKSYNQFQLTRGYLTVEKGINPWLGGRVTMDIHQDSTGDYKERLKYFYASLKPGDLGLLTDMKSEIGMGHTPWLDFEEHINPYRCQGTMAIERAGIFASSDAGISLQGDFGGKLEDAKALVGNTHYDGRFGSWHVGVYNGSGYHTPEDNNNKVVEYRLTVRPLADVLPGLQLSYFGLVGQGNTLSSVSGDYPDYAVNLGMLSYQNPTVILTAQYFGTKGNSSGSLVDASGDALNTQGFSVFGNVKLPVLDNKVAVFARYDRFNPDNDKAVADKADCKLYIAGLSYDVYKGNQLVVDYEGVSYEENSGGIGKAPKVGNHLGDDKKVQAVWQLEF